MAVSKNTIVITSNGPKGEKGSAVTVDGDAITSFSTIAITGDDNVVADQANDTVTFTGGENVSVSSSGSEVTIASNNTEYFLDTAQSGDDATITLTGTDASTDSITLAAGSGVTLTESGDTITIASTASGSAVTVQEDGVSLTTGVTTLNFTGDGVALNEPQPDNITVTISGDAGNKYLSFSDGSTAISPTSPTSELAIVAGGSSTLTVTADQLTDTLTIDGGRLQDETSPTLSAQLDVNNQRIYTTTTNGNISIQPNGTGVVSLGSSAVNDSVNISSGLIEVRNNNTQSEVRLYCENDSHYVSLKAPAHADIGASYTLTLPGDDGDANQYLKTDGSGNLSWATVSGGGAITGLDDLSDVAISNPSNGHVLIYDSGDSQFENAELTEGTNVRITSTAASITLAAGLGQELQMITQSTSDGAVNAATEAEGTIVKFGTGTLSAGTVYTYGSGAWVAVDADGDATTEGLLGLALGQSPTSDGLLVNGVGFIGHDNAATAAGEPLYISTTAGQITATQPTTGGDFVRVVGYALAAGNASGSKVFFSPSQDYIEIAT
jgi:hypothetical protein